MLAAWLLHVGLPLASVEVVFGLLLWLVCLLVPGELEDFDRQFR